MPKLDRVTARLQGEIARLKWRQDRQMRPGVVKKYDAEKHKAQVKLNSSSGEEFLTPLCDILEAAGGGTSRTTLTEGQTVWVLCPNGDLRGAQIMPGDFSDKYRSSSKAEKETRLEWEEEHLAVAPGKGTRTSGGATVRVEGGKGYLE